MPFLACKTAPPFDLGCPLHMLCINVAQKASWVKGGGEHLNQSERHEFQLSNDKRHVLSIFRTHAQNLKSTSSLIISALKLVFEK